MEESEKGRTARELHDITGQLVMGLTGEIENIDALDPAIKGQIKDKITDLGRSIRLISHRMNKAMLEHFTFEELVTGQCQDMQKLTGIKVLLTMPEQPLSLREETIQHTYRIIQELLVNAGKYVLQGTVKINIVSLNDKFTINYSDDGPGFEPDKLLNPGMGLMNINERAKLIGGKAIVKSSPGKGTTWEITAPIDGKG
jgi:signal transduction histidine kinase